MSKNKNEVTLEVIARTDPKTGAIVLTSRDRQIAGQPFVLRLNGDTPTFTTLKNLLNEEAVENKQVKRLSDLAEQGDTDSITNAAAKSKCIEFHFLRPSVVQPKIILTRWKTEAC